MKILNKDGLKYVDQGKGKDVLFFHGWAMTPYSYEIIIENLSSKFRVIAPFVRSFSNFREDELIIKSLLNKNTKTIVLGHSAGGIPALNYSSNSDDKIKALILIDSLGSGKSKLVSKRNWIFNGIKLFMLPNLISRTLIRDVLSQIPRLKVLLADYKFITVYKAKIKPKFPVLILWGKKDNIATIQSGYYLNSLIQGSRFKEVEGDHFWFLNNPDLLTQEINKFLN